MMIDDVQPLSLDSGGDVVDAYVVVYSVTDRSSFVYAQTCLADLKRRRKTLPPAFRSSAVVLVSNKQDLVRNRVVSESGKLLVLEQVTKVLQDSQEPAKRCCIGAGQTLRVHSPGGSTFLREIMSWPPS